MSLDLLGVTVSAPRESVAFDLTQDITNIIAVYSGDQLVQIKILNSTRIPRELYKILSMIVCFYPQLTSIVINKALNTTGVHELKNFLNLSNVTDIILDDTYVKSANYYILLDSPRRLRCLSLARCYIQDIGVELIAARLAFPHPASESLALLNLSTNRITDVGATYLATALRTNRCLSYLNLTSNLITDKGAKTIFDVLMPFPLTYSELIGKNERYIKHLRKKHDLIDTFITNVKNEESDSKSGKKKSARLETAANKRSIPSINAQDVAKKLISDFKDPFHKDIVLKDGVLYYSGNNILAYLNLSYNHLSYIILKTILEVLKDQRIRARLPKGLVRVVIEGNPMPMECKELKEISNELDICVQSFEKGGRALTAGRKSVK